MVNNARFRKWIVPQIRLEALPGKRLFLTPPIDPLKDQSLGNVMVSLNSPTITTDTVILIVTSQLHPQRRPPFLKLRGAAYISEPFIHPLACPAKLLSTGLTTQCRITFATLTPVMGKTQKVKGMGLVVFPVSPALLFSV